MNRDQISFRLGRAECRGPPAQVENFCKYLENFSFKVKWWKVSAANKIETMEITVLKFSNDFKDFF